MKKVIMIGIIIGVITIGKVLTSPLFYEAEVNELLPTVLDKIESGLTLETLITLQ